MIKGEFKFDLHDARDIGFPQYSWAYAVTNEPIEKWKTLISPKDKRVLTVAASGDQPLMFAAAGASYIDTFDVTINACAIMDFKTTAMKMHVNKAEYENLIFSFKRLHKPYDLFPYIVNNNMPDRTRALMQSHLNNRPRYIFFNKDFTSVYKPHFDRTTRKILDTPFNFIWADLMNLHKYLDCKYDIIYLSNIFDHYLFGNRDTFDILKTIWRMWPHLNTSGHILCVSNQANIQKLFYCAELILKILPIKASITFPPFDTNDYHWQPIIIQKTR